MVDEDSGVSSTGRELASAERVKAFTDAVVAIALTLLILPLMESVVEASRGEVSGAEWMAANQIELLVFVLSFVLIATFWMSHHRLFEQVHQVSGPLLVLNIAWMFTIVWLPVATATFGLAAQDAAQKSMYIGVLFANSVIMAALSFYTLKHPELHSLPERHLRHTVLAEAIAAAMFALAFVIAVAWPRVGYWSMTALVLIGPLNALLRRLLLGEHVVGHA